MIRNKKLARLIPLKVSKISKQKGFFESPSKREKTPFKGHSKIDTNKINLIFY